MGAMASQITSLAIVYATVNSGADQENINAPCHWPFCGEFIGDPWIPAQMANDAENDAPIMTSLFCNPEGRDMRDHFWVQCLNDTSS